LITPPPNIPTLDLNVIRDEFSNLLKSTVNKLDREWPKTLQNETLANVFFESLLRITENTYRSILTLAAEKSENPFHRREFGLSVPPLARSLLDILFSIVFVLQDIPAHARWYHRAGWREVRERHDMLAAHYGQSPEWTSWLAQSEGFLASTQSYAGISDAEAANLKLIEKWPLPGQMKNHSALSPERKQFLSYLYDWYYKEMSQDSHLSWAGMMRRSAPLLLLTFGDKATRKWQLDKQVSDSFATTMVLCLAIMSEIEIEFRFGLNARLKHMWSLINPVWGMGKELYDIRHAQLL